MIWETAEITKNIPNQITQAIEAKDAGNLIPLLKELNLALTGHDVSGPEFDTFLEQEVTKFLADPAIIDMILPLGGVPHLTIYREDGKISFVLNSDEDKEIERHWKEIYKK